MRHAADTVLITPPPDYCNSHRPGLATSVPTPVPAVCAKRPLPASPPESWYAPAPPTPSGTPPIQPHTAGTNPPRGSPAEQKRERVLTCMSNVYGVHRSNGTLYYYYYHYHYYYYYYYKSTNHTNTRSTSSIATTTAWSPPVRSGGRATPTLPLLPEWKDQASPPAESSRVRVLDHRQHPDTSIQATRTPILPRVKEKRVGMRADAKHRKVGDGESQSAHDYPWEWRKGRLSTCRGDTLTLYRVLN